MTSKRPTLHVAEQFEFDGLFNFGANQRLLTIKQVARALNMTDIQVRAHIDEGHFIAVGIGDQPNPQREHLRVERFSVVAWWREKHADLGNPDLPFHQTADVLFWREKLRAHNPKPKEAQ